ncbi:conserved exported hypothetical protein [metagenome]|uniref:Lipoprotein n=1 Tax=metagenome TaxID=256318 RepID=A0A2P2CEA9_9ZZZZ
MRPKAVRTALALAVVASLAVACGSQPPVSPPSGVDELVIPTPSPDPEDFVARIDNPLLPLSPGSTWVYDSTGGEDDETVTVRVLDETRPVAGLDATVVEEVTTGGDAPQEIRRFYAQDRAGNVWNLGTEGDWEAGVDGARAGIAMLAKPRLGDGYLAEDAPGVAEDQVRILALDADVVVPFGSFRDAVLTQVASPLEPTRDERWSYVVGIGKVAALDHNGGDLVVELVSYTEG